MGSDSRRKRISFRIVGANHDIVRCTVEGLTVNFLVKKNFVENLLSGRIMEAYALEASDSEQWRSKRPA